MIKSEDLVEDVSPPTKALLESNYAMLKQYLENSDVELKVTHTIQGC